MSQPSARTGVGSVRDGTLRCTPEYSLACLPAACRLGNRAPKARHVACCVLSSMRWLLFAGLLLAPAPARAEDAHAEMARALEAAADREPAAAALPTVSPVAQAARGTPARAPSSKAAAKASAAANG